MKLKERIGIDRSVVYNFTLLAIDQNKLYNQQGNDKAHIVLMLDDTSPIVLTDDTRVGKLIIQDQYIGKLNIEFKQNNLTGAYCTSSILEIMVSDNSNNLQNLTAAEYKQRIDAIFVYLANQYGVQIDHSNLKIKKIEINATFLLDTIYEQYKQPILYSTKYPSKTCK